MLKLPSGSVFKSILQKEAVVHCVQMEDEDILGILHTGGGKSHTYILSAYFNESKVNIVILSTVLQQLEFFRNAWR